LSIISSSAIAGPTVSVSRGLLQHFPNYFIVADEDGHPPLEKQDQQEVPDQDSKVPNQSHRVVMVNSFNRDIDVRGEKIEVAALQTSPYENHPQEPSSDYSIITIVNTRVENAPMIINDMQMCCNANNNDFDYNIRTLI
jgi:hypothetical protein